MVFVVEAYPLATDAVVVSWLSHRLGHHGRTTDRVALAYRDGDGLPFRLVTQIAGSENVDQGTVSALIQVDTLCAKVDGFDACAEQASRTHRAMLALARYMPSIRLRSGPFDWVSVDYVNVETSQLSADFQDEAILRRVGRYEIGMCYVPVTQQVTTQQEG